MTKTMKIEGMMCTHCSGRVEKALNALEGVTAVVDLQAGTATVTMTAEVSDEDLTKLGNKLNGNPADLMKELGGGKGL